MGTIKANQWLNIDGTENYKCRAWVNFNGTGTVAIRASGNVSSITDNGVGIYTINFTNAMVDTNYSALITIGGTSNAYISRTIEDTTARTPSAISFTTVLLSGTTADPQYVSVAILR